MRRRHAAIGIVLLLVLPTALALPVQGRFRVTIEGPVRVGTSASYDVSGDVTISDLVPVGALNVSIFESGRYVTSAGTVLGGTYHATLRAPATAGPITLVAKVFNNATLQSQSAPLTITVYPPPEPPTDLALALDDITSSVRITWGPSPEAHGDLDRYVVWRKLGTGAWEEAHAAPPSGRAWEDGIPAWNDVVSYRVTARSDAGHSLPTPTATIVLPDGRTTNPSTVENPSIQLCDVHSFSCANVAPGNYTLNVDDVRVRVVVTGTLRGWNGEPQGNVTTTVHGEARWSCDGCTTTFASGSRTFQTRPNGYFVTSIDDMFVLEFNPGECRTLHIDVMGFDDIILAEGDSRYRLCF